MSKIAVIGIAGESVFLSVDGFGKTGETTVAESFHNELGGKGFNQAVAAARYGAEVSFLCACYQGDVERFTEIAERNGIKSFFVGKKERSPYAVITTDKNGDNRVLVYRGAELDEQDVELFANEIKTADILLINNEVPIPINEKAVQIAKGNGVRVVLNPAPQRIHGCAFLENVDLFTPNEHETGGLENYQNVIVTLGDKGCLIRKTGELIPAFKVEKVIDTAGAGDTFNGVLCACLAENADLKTACQTANIAAAIKVGRKYILNSIPSRTEIEKEK
ncbi:MAG: ribokinase [Clostridiales bacterium]|nr:ribokinase [Clostridiales bacterium]